MRVDARGSDLPVVNGVIDLRLEQVRLVLVEACEGGGSDPGVAQASRYEMYASRGEALAPLPDWFGQENVVGMRKVPADVMRGQLTMARPFSLSRPRVVGSWLR